MCTWCMHVHEHIQYPMRTCLYFRKFIRFVLNVCMYVNNLFDLFWNYYWIINLQISNQNGLMNKRKVLHPLDILFSCAASNFPFSCEATHNLFMHSFPLVGAQAILKTFLVFFFSITILYVCVCVCGCVCVKSIASVKISWAIKSESNLFPFGIVLINIANINTCSFINTAQFARWKICFALTHTDRSCALCSMLMKIKPQINTLIQKTVGTWVWAEPFWRTLGFSTEQNFSTENLCVCDIFQPSFSPKITHTIECDCNWFSVLLNTNNVFCVVGYMFPSKRVPFRGRRIFIAVRRVHSLFKTNEKVEGKINMRLSLSDSLSLHISLFPICASFVRRIQKSIHLCEHCPGMRFLLAFLSNTLLVIRSYHSFLHPFAHNPMHTYKHKFYNTLEFLLQ